VAYTGVRDESRVGDTPDGSIRTEPFPGETSVAGHELGNGGDLIG
jgi:hypothetical protein